MTQDITTEIASIENMISENPKEYYRDEGMQERLRVLYDARDNGGDASGAVVSHDRTEIERIMETDSRRYYRDEAMQERYRELLAAEDEPDPGQVEDGGFIEIPSFNDWCRAGNDPAEYQHLDELATVSNDVLWSMPDGAREQFGRSFAQLPERALALAFGTLTDQTPVAANPLMDDAMSELRRVPAYAELIDEWGREAPYKLGVAQERLWRVVDNLNDHDAKAIIAWFNGLPKTAAKALCRRLAI